MNKQNKTILLDLDGVLNSYTGEYKENFIPNPKDNVAEFLEKLSKKYDLKLFTTRNKKLAKEWLETHKLSEFFSEVTNTKQPAWLIVDDRCIRFRGEYDILLEEIENFEVWYKNKKERK